MYLYVYLDSLECLLTASGTTASGVVYFGDFTCNVCNAESFKINHVQRPGSFEDGGNYEVTVSMGCLNCNNEIFTRQDVALF